MDAEASSGGAGLSLSWVGRGIAGSLTLGLVFLSLSFVGFGAYARDAGFALWQMVFMSMSMWALPSILVFASSIATGGSILATAIAVALSAVRLMPMTIALLPLLGNVKKQRIWLVVAVHYVAVTAYVEGFLRLPKLPEEHRLAYFVGFGTSLMIIATTAGAFGFLVAGALPKVLSIGLVLISPLYFLISMLKTATTLSEQVAVASGLVLGPIAHSINAEFDLLIGGVVAGVLGFAVQRWQKGRRG